MEGPRERACASRVCEIHVVVPSVRMIVRRQKMLVRVNVRQIQKVKQETKY